MPPERSRALAPPRALAAGPTHPSILMSLTCHPAASLPRLGSGLSATRNGRHAAHPPETRTNAASSRKPSVVPHQRLLWPQCRSLSTEDIHTLVTASYSYGELTLQSGLVHDQCPLRTGHVTRSGPMRFNPGTCGGNCSPSPRLEGGEQEPQAPSLRLWRSAADAPGRLASTPSYRPLPHYLDDRQDVAETLACDFGVHERHQGFPLAPSRMLGQGKPATRGEGTQAALWQGPC